MANQLIAPDDLVRDLGKQLAEAMERMTEAEKRKFCDALARYFFAVNSSPQFSHMVSE